VVSADVRRRVLSARSAQLIAALAYVSAGNGESTTDAVFGGHGMIVEDGKPLAEHLPMEAGNELTVSEIDVDRLVGERRRVAFPVSDGYREIAFSMPICETVLTRLVDPHPFIPNGTAERSARCESILRIQSAGLAQRTERAFAKKLVLGISGGLDSTLALLVAVRAMDALKRPRTDVIAVTMPCFGTTKRTKTNATVLCEKLGVDFRCVNIFDAVNQHFADIGHDPACRDVTYENCQARERTQVLMDIANDCGGMVVGTGDLSELALGWATYNGDHMSMYGVNGGVPKTLIRHVVAYSADQFEKSGEACIASALRDVLDTPVSPELLPADANGEIAQKTEDLVGPYELHDFYLYYLIRYGFSPEKLYRLAKAALGSVYDDETLKKWLKVLLRRFFSQQFKRSCLPDGPAVGSVALSPRGAWSMPSDATATIWLAEADAL
jgi:NAD+ synthase (glutamine-hydrolysing)